MRTVRDLLRNEYIGAIAIGFVLAQAIDLAINTILRPIQFYLDPRRQSSLYGTTDYHWNLLLSPVITIVLYGIVAFSLFWWLYMKSEPETAPENTNAAAADLFE